MSGFVICLEYQAKELLRTGLIKGIYYNHGDNGALAKDHAVRMGHKLSEHALVVPEPPSTRPEMPPIRS